LHGGGAWRGRADGSATGWLAGFIARRPNKHVLYGIKLRLHGRQRFISIGSEAEFSPDQARGEAEKIRAAKRQGLDPAAERERRKAGHTLDEAADRFLSEHVRPKLRISTNILYEEIIEGLIRSKFGKWRFDGISHADVSKWHVRLAATPYRANRALAILSSMMAWGTRQGFRSGDNPCEGIQRFREFASQRFLTLDELARIFRALEELVAQAKLSLFFAAGIKLLCLTGARRSEIFKARWSWLDVDRCALVLPDSKTGPKTIRLTAEAMDVIARLPRYADNLHLLPGLRRGEPIKGFSAAWALVLKRAGIEGCRIHDLRHSYASLAVDQGTPLLTIGKLLGHAKAATTQRYAHLREDPVRAAANLVSTAVIEAARANGGVTS
jgi:integrase